MRILVTGGAGFIGSHYVRNMLAGAYPGYEQAHVTMVDKLTYAGDTANLPMGHPRLSFVHADVCDEEAMLKVMPGHDAVVHFAAETHVDRSLYGARQFVLTNVLGTQTLLECAMRTGLPRLVLVSTDEVYGSIEQGAWTEQDPLLPNSPYSASKAGADLIARAYHKTHGLNVCITRTSNNYGPRQFVEKVIPLFITNLLDGLPVPLYGDGMNIREWIHVDDHCRGIQLVLEKGTPGEIYNIGGGLGITNRELTDRLLRLCGRDESCIRFVADRKGHDRRYALDDRKIREQLGYEPRIDFAVGLEQTVEWYRANRDWWEPQVARNRTSSLSLTR